MRRGFTLIEVLVACVLLGILVSMLTTIFSQSSIAWSVGTSMVQDMGDSRRDISGYQFDADAALDRNGAVVQNVFQGDGGGRTLNTRAVAVSGNLATSKFGDPSSWTDIGAGSATEYGSADGMGNGKDYFVGVTSWGPDRVRDTWDDITTWPAEEN